MEDDGADIIDVGGESTRPPSVYPDARPIPADEEMERVLPVISQLAQRCSAPISIDTRKAAVADAALAAGARMANDVSMLSDTDMAATVAKHHAPIVISHIRPRAHYKDVVGEIVLGVGRRDRQSAVRRSRHISDHRRSRNRFCQERGPQPRSFYGTSM